MKTISSGWGGRLSARGALVLLSLCAGALLPAGPATAADGAIKKVWVVAIGVNKYANRNYISLPAAKDGAVSIARALQDAQPDLTQPPQIFTSDNPDELLQPRRGAILKAFSDLKQKVGESDRVVVYFCGHGIEPKGKPYLLLMDLSDYKDPDALIAGSLSVEELRNRLQELKCKESMLLLDACRIDSLEVSGNADHNDSSQPVSTSMMSALANAGAGRQTVTFFGCQKGERVLYGDRGLSLLSEALVAGLSGDPGAVNRKDQITAASLGKYVKQRVPELAKKLKKTQTPMIYPEVLSDDGWILRPGLPNIACPPMAVLTDNPDAKRFAPTFTDRAITHLVESRDITLVERGQLQKVMDELKFESAMLADEEKAKSLGRKLTNVNYLVLGTVGDVPGGLLQINLRLVEFATGKVTKGCAASCRFAPTDPEAWEKEVVGMTERLLTLMRETGILSSKGVRIESEPSGATVRLNEVLQPGETPLSLHKVKVGDTVILQLSKPGYLDFRQRLTIDSLRMGVIKLQPTAAPPEVSTDLPGLAVTLRCRAQLIAGGEKLYGTPEFGEGRYWVAKATVKNTGEATYTNLRVTYQIGDASVTSAPYLSLAPGQVVTDTAYPAFPTPLKGPALDVAATVTYDAPAQPGQVATSEKRQLAVVPRGEFIFADEDARDQDAWKRRFAQAPLLAALLTPEEPAVSEVAGYIKDGFKDVPATAAQLCVALYNFLDLNRVTVTDPANFLRTTPAKTAVRLPWETLEQRGGTSLDVALLYASACLALGLSEAQLCLIPGEVAVLVPLPDASGLRVTFSGLTAEVRDEPQGAQVVTRLAPDEVQQAGTGERYRISPKLLGETITPLAPSAWQADDLVKKWDGVQKPHTVPIVAVELRSPATPLPASCAPLYGMPEFADGKCWAAEVTVKNDGKTPVTNVRVTYQFGTHSWPSPTPCPTLAPGASFVNRAYPRFPAPLVEKQALPITATVTYVTPEGTERTRKCKPGHLQVLSPSEFVFAPEADRAEAEWQRRFAQAPLLAAFLTPTEPIIKELAKLARQNSYAEVITPRLLCERLYDLFVENRLTVSDPKGFLRTSPPTTTVKVPWEALKDRGGSSLDVALLYASACQALNTEVKEVQVSLTPGAAAVLVTLPDNTGLRVEFGALTGGEGVPAKVVQAVSMLSREEVKQWRLTAAAGECCLIPEKPLPAVLPAATTPGDLRNWGYKGITPVTALNLRCQSPLQPTCTPLYSLAEFADGKYWAAQVTVKNAGKVPVTNVRVTYQFDKFTWKSTTPCPTLAPGKEFVDTTFPAFPEPLPPNSTLPVTASVAYITLDETELLQTTSGQLTVLGPAEFVFADKETGKKEEWHRQFRHAPLLAAFLTPAEVAVVELAALARKNTYVEVPTPHQLCNTLYKLLVENQVAITDPADFLRFVTPTTTVKAPWETLRDQGGTSLDVALLYASTCVALGLEETHLLLRPASASVLVTLPDATGLHVEFTGRPLEAGPTAADVPAVRVVTPEQRQAFSLAEERVLITEKLLRPLKLPSATKAGFLRERRFHGLKPNLTFAIRCKSPLPARFAKVYSAGTDAEGIFWVAKVSMENIGTVPVSNVRVTYKFGDFSYPSPTPCPALAAGAQFEDTAYPRLPDAHLLALKPALLVTATITYLTPENTELTKELASQLVVTAPVKADGPVEFLFADDANRTAPQWRRQLALAPLLAALLTPADFAVLDLVAHTKERHIKDRKQAPTTRQYCEEIFEHFLQKEVELREPGEFLRQPPERTMVQLPWQTMCSRGGTSLDLALLYTSICLALDLDAQLCLQPEGVSVLVTLKPGARDEKINPSDRGLRVGFNAFVKGKGKAAQEVKGISGVELARLAAPQADSLWYLISPASLPSFGYRDFDYPQRSEKEKAGVKEFSKAGLFE
jgi:hypothetical protein